MAGKTQLFSSGFETACFVASSGILSSPWNLILELNAETNPNEILFWQTLGNGSDLTIIAFGTTLQLVQPDLVCSTDMLDNPFEFLCSRNSPSFSLNESAVSLFNEHSQNLGQLKLEIDLKKPVIVTGHGVGGSIASLFTLWLIEKMGLSDRCPLCITFGSPLIGDKCLQVAISQSSRWNSCFLHVASHRDPLVSTLISNDSYRPFGTFLLCSDIGSTCSENPDSILRLIKEISIKDQGFHQFQGYGNIVENLTSQAICKDSDVPNIPRNLLQAGFALQLQALGSSNSQVSQNNLVKDLERQEVLLALHKRKLIIPHKKLYEMKKQMVYLEWYKKTGKNSGRGYYDCYKNEWFSRDMEMSVYIRILNNYWKGVVEEAGKQPQKEGAAFRTRWLYAGTSYRRMVEPLDIARYYREGGKDYINEGRSEHYKLLQKWQEEDQKKSQEEDKKTEPLNRKINVKALLTWDSCFWAHVEEAIITLNTCECASFNLVKKQEAMKRLEEFEEYVYGLLKTYTVSPEIFLESTYMRWWNEYIRFKGGSHRSSLANFMRNYVMYEKGEYDLVKDDSSLTWDLVKDALAIIGEPSEYKSTRKNLETVVKDLSPLVEKIEQSMKQMEVQSEHVQKLKDMLTKSRGDLGKHKIHWWNSVLALGSRRKLSREHTSLQSFVSVQTQIQMLQVLTEILSLQRSHCQSLGSQTSSAPKTHDDRTQIFPPRFTEGLDVSYTEEMKAKLLDANEQVLNLYGLPGSGKTTMAKKLCHDLEAEGKFKKIIYRTLGSQTQSDEAMKMLNDELSPCGEDPVLLVLDDVWPHSEDIVEKIHLRSSYSRILVTSKAQMTKVRSRCQMKLLSDQDAEKLLRNLIQPSEVDFNDPETRRVLLQIVEGCKGLPLALEIVGRKLQGKPIEAFQKTQLEWSRGDSILDSHEDLLACLQSSVDESIRDYFMDLGLFPEDQKIPITSIIDMWTELYDLNEPASSSAFLIIQELIAMNLAAGVLVRRKIGWDYVDNYYNNCDLVQHGLSRELAIHMSQQEPFEKRSRLIIDLYGTRNQNQPPKSWPKQQPIVVSPPILSISTDQNIVPDWCNIQAADTVVLVLNLNTLEYTLPEFIREMEKLKVLIVTNYGYSRTYLRNLYLLSSLLNLKRIRLQKVSIPSLCDLKNVHKLSLYMCDVKEAFENNSIDFSEAMPKLEDLGIEYCNDLVKLPTGFCHIVTMKNLTISSCNQFTRLPEEIGKLENLELLRINFCSAFGEIPDSITKLRNLSLLDISFCGDLRKLPDNIGELQNLKKLYMTGCSVRELPESVIHLNKLESVICDEYAFPLWEVFTSCFSRLNIKMVDDMDVNLDWLS